MLSWLLTEIYIFFEPQLLMNFPWVMGCTTDPLPWAMGCTTPPWFMNFPWVMGHTTTLPPWVMGHTTTLPPWVMGHTTGLLPWAGSYNCPSLMGHRLMGHRSYSSSLLTNVAHTHAVPRSEIPLYIIIPCQSAFLPEFNSYTLCIS